MHITAFKLCLLALVFVSWASATREKTLNIRIGFDLTKGKNGEPALRLRNYDDSILRSGKEKHNRHHNLRAGSDSAPGSEEKKHEVKHAEIRADSDSEDSAGSGKEVAQDPNPKSTMGIKNDEFEPEAGQSDRRKKRGADFYRRHWSSRSEIE